MNYIQYCCIFLLLWSIRTLSQTKKKIHVSLVDRCPTDLSSWERASRDLNCTSADIYQCTSNQNLTSLVEFCYDQPSTFVLKGYCWILLNSNYVDTYNCSGFTDGCPNSTYRSNELYKYQKCLQLDKLKGCFRADKACLKQKYTNTAEISTSRTTRYTNTAEVPTSRTTREVTKVSSTVTNDSTYKIIIVLVSVVIFIITNALALIIFIRRSKAYNRHIRDSENGGIPLLDNPSRRNDNSEGSKDDILKAILKKRGSTIRFNDLRLKLIKGIPESKLDALKRSLTVMASMEISLDNVTSVAEFIDFLLDKDIFKERDVLTMQYLLTSIDRPDLELKCIEYARKNRQALCYYKETTPNEDGLVQLRVHVVNEIKEFTDLDLLLETVAAILGSDPSSLKIDSVIRSKSFIIVFLVKAEFASLLLQKNPEELRGLLKFNVDWIEIEGKSITIPENCPNLIIQRIVPRGKDIDIEYSVTVSEECRAFTTLIWTKDSSVLDLSEAAVKYIGGTLTDSCLRILNVNADDHGNYECKIQNIFGKTTVSLSLDEIRCTSKESQGILLSFLLLDGFCLRKGGEDQWEDKLKLSYNFCFGNTNENIRESALAILENLDLDYFIGSENNEFRLHSPEDIVQYFMTRDRFLDFFLAHAHPFGVDKFCRAPGYRKRQNEICCVLHSEQFKVLVKRLRFIILSTNMIDDQTSHEIIEDKLRIPKVILSLGSEGISKYLEDLKGGEHVVYCARGMLVGCQGAGKTSLLLRLRGESTPDPTSTRGIDVHMNVFAVYQGRLEGTADQNIPSLRSNFRSEEEKSSIKIAEVVKIQSFAREENDGHKHVNTEAFVDLLALDTIQLENSQTETISYNDKMNENHKQDMKSSTSTYVVQEEEKNDNVEIIDFSRLPFDETDVSEYDITVQTLSESYKDKNRKVISFFDFAGHFEHYACHHIYFSPNNFYILVMDITKKLNDVVYNDSEPSDSKDRIMGSVYSKWTYLEFIEYWMQSILSHTVGLASGVKADDDTSMRKSPLILVATHGEGKSKKDVEEYFCDLRDKLPEFSAHVDYGNAFCTCFGGDLREIEDCIRRVVQTLPNWGEKLPMCWFHIENLIRNIKGRKIIFIRELLDICIARNIGIESYDDIVTPLQYLHNIGVVLFFDEVNLRHFAILDVQWFVDAFKHVITDDAHAQLDIPYTLYRDWKSFNETGLLTCSLLLGIWKYCKDGESYISKEKEIISYMIRLNLMTEVSLQPADNSKQSKTWYCPCMNKQTFPTEEFENLQNSSILCFQFHYLPKDFFHRLLAACSNQLRWGIMKMEYLCIYQTATIFDVNGTKVLIGLYSNNKIVIQLLDVVESTTVDYLMVRKHVTQVIDRLAEKLVNCKYDIGYMCKKTVFEKMNGPLSHFIAESDMDKESIYCPKCGFNRKVVVKEIAWNATSNRSIRGRHKGETQNGPDRFVNQILSINVIGVDNVSHIASVKSGRIWLYDKNKIVEIDMKGITQRSIETGWNGGHTTLTDSGDLLYIDGNDIRKLSPNNENDVFLKIDHSAWCIHSSRLNGDVLVGVRVVGNKGFEYGMIVRYSRSGEKLKEIRNQFYANPRHVCENINGEICVSDYDKDIIVVVSKNGILLFSYRGQKSEHFFHPRGICCDSSGNLLVCNASSWNSSVHILDQMGRFLCFLLTPQHGIMDPMSICFDDEKVYIGQNRSNTIKVYKYHF